MFTNALAQVHKTHEALLLTEFGATRAAGDLTGMVQRADRYMVPWLEWAYCGCHDPTGSGDNEAVVLDPRKPPIGSNVVLSTLRLLVEPYPQVIAGTPLSWSFDRARRVFRLRYTTKRVSGRGRFASGAITEISVPRLVYRGSYAVRADGGAIVSARGSSLLQIAACPGARRVSVTVRRSGASHASCRIPLARAARRS